MSGLKITFTDAVVPDGKTAEMQAAQDFENIANKVAGVDPMSW